MTSPVSLHESLAITSKGKRRQHWHPYGDVLGIILQA